VPALRDLDSSTADVAERLLQIADDELVLGWRDSEWTGIAPLLEEDVALSSIAQGEIGHARALYELAASTLGTTPDELAFDRKPEEYRSAPFVELRLVRDWARTIARRWLYETADGIRVEALKDAADPGLAGLAEKMEREEAYHRMHADMWVERLRDEPRFQAAVEELWPYALGVLADSQREELTRRVRSRLPEAPDVEADPVERGAHADDWPALWDEMTSVRRSIPGATW
jgi:ring-1,2-phenylacetyl-CoA epoxidase subunit PaaC